MKNSDIVVSYSYIDNYCWNLTLHYVHPLILYLVRDYISPIIEASRVRSGWDGWSMTGAYIS